MNHSILDQYLTRTQLAAELGVCERTFIRWCVLGQGPAMTKIGRKPMFHRAAVEAWLAARQQRAA
jgi:predicted DNA-binding transcriptional regulator AlpA